MRVRTPTRPACTRWATATTTPTLGRFTQPDPSGQETNPYLYAGGDPINRMDPTGLGFLDSVSDALDSANDWVGAAVGCIGAV
ncbi:RHS repeat-associated core domain-containing protein [Streptomyces pseudogriseolus]